MEGFLVFNDKYYFFTFNNFILKIIPKDEHYSSAEDIVGMFNGTKKENTPEILKGDLINSVQRKIYLFIKSEITHTINTGVHEFEIYAYVESMDDEIEIDTISIYNEELNWFYNIAKSYGVSFVDSTGEIYVNIKEHKQVSKSFNFKVNDKDILTTLNISRNISTMDRNPITLDSILRFEFSTTKDLNFIIKLIYITEEFLSFIAYRKNVYVTRVDLNKKRADGKYVECGKLFINRDEDLFIESSDTIRNRMIDFDLVEEKCGNIFQILSDEVVYLNHIPYNSRDLNTITSSRFVLITAAFEWEFTHIYGDVKNNENAIFREAKSETMNFFEEKINNTTGKKKNYIKSYMKIINNCDMSLSDKILRALNDNNSILDIFISNLYRINGIDDFKYADMAKRIQTQRNNYAHGNIDKKLNSLVILDLIVLEWVIYALILKECGIDDMKIQKCINKLFKMNMAI